MFSIQDLLLPEPVDMSANSSFSSSRRRPDGSQSGRSQPPAEIIDLTDSPPQPAPLPYIPPPTRTNAQQSLPNERIFIDLDTLPDTQPAPPRRARVMQTARRRPTHLPGDDVTRNTDVVMLGDDNPFIPASGFPGILTMLRNRFYGSPEQEPEGVHYHLHVHPQPQPRQFRAPGVLNYALNAGHVYGNDGSLRDLPCFKDENYTAPSPARDGFTRSPTDAMALICPECLSELGRNVDNVKKEVWVAKCGHVYCGTCAAAHRQNRAKGPKVGRCLVEGCSKIVSGDKGMIEVFL